jgi:hypothetical protein
LATTGSIVLAALLDFLFLGGPLTAAMSKSWLSIGAAPCVNDGMQSHLNRSSSFDSDCWCSKFIR